MKRLLAVAWVGLAILWGASVALAAPKSGLGIWGSLLSSEEAFSVPAANSFTGAKLNFTGSASGVGFGADYQIAMGDLSINPFVEYDQQSVSFPSSKVGSGSWNTATHYYVGVQVRYWIEKLFVGAQLGYFSDDLTGEKQSFGVTDYNGTGQAYGIAGGWEDDNGLMASLQIDFGHTEFKFSGQKKSDTIDTTTYRANVGWRFK